MPGRRLRRITYLVLFTVALLYCPPASADVTGRPHDLSLTNPKGHCINCHDPHQTKLGQGFSHTLKRANEIAVCYQCHAGSLNNYSSIDPSFKNITGLYSHYDIRSEFGQPHIHFPRYGMDGEHNKCSYCHNPHGVFNHQSTTRKPKLLSAGPDAVTDTDDFCLVCHNSDPNPPHQKFSNISVGAQYRFSRSTYKQMRHSTFFRWSTANEPVPDTARTYDDNPYGKGKDISCLTCHRPHGSANDHMLKAPDDQGLCLNCHKGGVVNGTALNNLGMFTSVGHGKSGARRVCQDCHFPHGTGQKHAIYTSILDPHTNTHKAAFVNRSGMNAACFACHGSPGVAGYYTGKSAYKGGIHRTSANAHNPKDTINNLAAGDCDNCHDPHGSAYAPDGSGGYLLGGRGYSRMMVEPDNQSICYDCHNAATPNTGSGRDVQASFTRMSSSHDLTRVRCVNCHNVHTATATAAMMNPYKPQSTISGNKTFCLSCHSGTMPAGVTGAPVINAEWTGNGHDKTHKLLCSDCHDPHGSPNTKTLNYQMRSFSGVNAGFTRGMKFSSRAYCLACHNRTGTGYKGAMQIITGVAGGNVSQHYQSDTTACSACHAKKHDPSLWNYTGGSKYYSIACLDCHKQGVGNPYPSPDTDFNTPTVPNDLNTYTSTHALTYSPGTGVVDCVKCHGANHTKDHRRTNKITDPNLSDNGGIAENMSSIRISNKFCLECHDSSTVTLGGKLPPLVQLSPLSNGGFEDSTLDYWSPSGGGLTAARDATAHNSGTASVKLTNIQLTCWDFDPDYGDYSYDCTQAGYLNSQSLAVRPSTTYQYAGYVNVPSAFLWGNTSLYVTEYTSAGAYVTQHYSTGASLTTGWQRITDSWTTNPATGKVVLSIALTGPGTAYWDDLESSAAASGGHDKTHVLVCVDCHEYHRSVNKKLLDYTPRTSGGYTASFMPGISFSSRALCESCHNRTGLGYKNAKMIPTGAGYTAQHNQTDTTPCSTCHTDKHNPTIPATYYTTSCLDCHKAGTGNPYPNADAEFNTPTVPNDANTRASAHKINYAPPSTVDCAICHGANHKTDHSPTSKVIDPDPAHPATKSLDIRSTSAFCLQCHDATPVSIGGVVPPNILDTYTAAGHGKSTISGVICYDCHEYHGSYNKKLIKTAVRGSAVMPNYSGDNASVCVACHKGTYPTIPYWPGYSVYSSSIHSFGNRSTGNLASDRLHGAGACVNCHNPHGVRVNGKTTRSMLYSNEEDLCYRCHNAATPNTSSGDNVQARFQMATRHKISAADQLGPDGIAGTADDSKVECTDCHDPHTITEKLMGFNNISDAGGKRVIPVATDQDFCLKCHNPSPPKTVKFPQQGNWDKSLFDSSAHGNPLKRYKGFGNYSNSVKYSCKVCHNPHGSNQVALQRESWDINRDGIPDDIDGDGILDSSTQVGFIGYSTGTKKVMLVSTMAGMPSRAAFKRISTTIPYQANGSIDVELCLNCHDGTPAPDVRSDFKKPSHHPVEYSQQVALGGAKVECYNCHDQHRAQARNDAAGEYPTTNPKGQREPMPGDAAFCLKCHDNNPPATVSFGSLQLKNIKLSYNPTNRLDSKGYDLLTSFTGHYVQSTGAPLMCRDCHNQHGSDYSKMLRDNTEPGKPNYDSSQPIQGMRSMALSQSDPFSGGDNLPVSSTAERCLACHSGGTTYKGGLIPLPPPPDADVRGFTMAPVALHPDSKQWVTYANGYEGADARGGRHVYSQTFALVTTPGSVKDTCTQCHDSHSPYIPTQDGQLMDCFRCHNQNTSLPDVQTEFNANPINPARSKSMHPIKYDPTGTASTSVECLKCHDMSKHMKGKVRLRKDPSQFINYTSDAAVWFDPVNSRTVNQFCLECHGPNATVASSFFSGGVEHVPVKLPAGYASGAHFTNGTLLCTDCHEYHGSKSKLLLKNDKGEEESFCYSCHSNPAKSMDGINIKNMFSTTSSASHHTVDAAEQAAMGSKVECADCHNPHSVTRSSPVVNTSDKATAIPADDTFCLGCHSSTGAPGVKFPGYTTGGSAPEWDPNTGRWNKWDKSGFTSTAHKGNGIACEKCHDPHGSKNYDLLLTNISSSRSVKVSFGMHSTARGGRRVEELGINSVCYPCHKQPTGAYDGFASFTSSTWGTKNGIAKNCTYCHNPHSSQPKMIHAAKPLYMNMTSRNFGSVYNFKKNRGFGNPTTGAPYYAFCSSRGCHASEKPQFDSFNLDLPMDSFLRDGTAGSHHPVKEGIIGCTSCHKEHGASTKASDSVSPDLRAPFFRGSNWPNVYHSGKGTAGGGNGEFGGSGGDSSNYFYNYGPNTATPPDNANDLCFMCHQKDDMIGSAATGMSGTNTKFLGHEAVKGGAYVSQNISPWGNVTNSDYHSFSCSACHLPHSSTLQKTLKVGCMSQADSPDNPLISGDYGNSVMFGCHAYKNWPVPGYNHGWRNLTTASKRDFARPPNAVPDLTASVQPNLWVSLSWHAVADAPGQGADHYNVYRYSQAITQATKPYAARIYKGVAGGSVGTVLTWTDSGVVNNTTYYYVVVACDQEGNESFVSNCVVAALGGDTLSPNPVSDQQTFREDGNTRIKITWHSPGDNIKVTQFNVYRKPGTAQLQAGDITSGNLIGTVADSVPQGSPDTGLYSFEDATAQAAQSYSYAVVALDAVGNVSPLPTGSTFSIAGDTTPPPAISTQQTSRINGSSSISVTWHDPGDDASGTYVSSYKIYRKAGTTPLANGDIILANYLATVSDTSFGKAPDGNTYGYTDTTAQVSQSYSYAVVAVDAAGNVSSVPTGSTFTINADTTPPPAISTQQTSRVNGTTSISVTWHDPGDDASGTYVASYKVYRKAGTTPLANGDIILANYIATVSDTSFGKTPDGNTYIYTDATAQVSQSYSYAVVAVDAAGNVSSVPTGSTFTINADTTPPPAISTQQMTQQDGGLSIVLTWRDPGDDANGTYVASYKVYRMTSATPMADGDITAPNYLAAVNDTSWGKAGDAVNYTYTDSTAQMGQTYAYAVVAIDAAGNVSPVPTGTALVVTASDPAPAPVTLTSATPVTGDVKAALSWTVPADIGTISGYNVYRKASSALVQGDLVPGNCVASLVPGTSCQAPIAADGVTYYYSVTAVDASSGKESRLGNSRSLSIPAPPGLSANGQSNSVAALSWTAPSYLTNFQNYKVYQRINSGNWSIVTTTTQTTTSINLAGQQPGAYDFAVTANYSTYSGVTPYESAKAIASISITDTAAPAAIGSLTGALSASSGFSNARISWTAPSDQNYSGYTPAGVDHYIVEANYSGSWTAINSNYRPAGYNSPGTAQSFDDPTALAPGSSATYRVTSVDAANNYSAPVVSGAVSARPTAITSLSVTNSPTTSAAVLTFSASSSRAGLSKYYVYAKEQTGPLASLTGATLIGTVTTLVPTETFVHNIQNVSLPAYVGHTYAYAVIAEDVNGTDSTISGGAATTLTVLDHDAPASVSDLTAASPVGTTTVVLNWSTPVDNSGSGAGTGARYYEIYRVPADSVGTPAPVTDANYATSGLVGSGTYASSVAGTPNSFTTTWYDHQTAFYAVRSVDNSGNWSAVSNSPYVTVGKDITPPAPPVITRCTPAASPEVDVYWTPATDVDNASVNGYRLFRADSNQEPFKSDGCITENNIGQATVVFDLIPYNYTIMPDTGGVPGKTYFYALKTWDDEGNMSNISNCGIATVALTAADSTPPSWGGPAPLSATQGGYPDIDLIWTAASDLNDAGAAGSIDHYDVYRSLVSFSSAADPNATKIATVSGIRTSYVDNTGQPNTTYYYGLVASDASTAHNKGAISNVVSATVAPATTPDNTPPTAPTSLTASTGIYPYINLSWGSSTDVDDAGSPQMLNYYKLYRSDYPLDITDANKNNAALVKTFILANDATAYSIVGMGGTSYNFRLEAFDLAGNPSGMGNQVAGQTAPAPCVDTTPPSAPTGLAATVGPSPDMELSWTPSTDTGCPTGNVVDHYLLYRVAYTSDPNVNPSAALGSATPVFVTGNATTFTDSSGAPNTTYWYALRAVDDAGNISTASGATAPFAGIITATTAADTMAPAAVSDLKASQITGGGIQLTWCKPSDNVGIAHYEIYRKQQPTILTDADISNAGNRIVGSFINAGTCLSFNDNAASAANLGYPAVVSGNAYSYAVIAVDASGNRSTISRGAQTGDTIATAP